MKLYKTKKLVESFCTGLYCNYEAFCCVTHLYALFTGDLKVQECDATKAQ